MKKKLLITSALVAGCVVAWVVVSLRNDDSTVSVIAKKLVRKMGLAGDSTTFEALARMSKYESQGQFDDAIQTGITWAQQHPDDGSNDLVYKQLATLFLEKAQKNTGHAEEYVKQALVYRDKALPLDSDPSRGWRGMAGLRDLAFVSESAGDLSNEQRCLQYRNADKLFEEVIVRLREKQRDTSSQSNAGGGSFTADDVNQFVEKANAAQNQVRAKLQSSGCL